MTKIIGWKIWYSNNTFDSTQGNWKECSDEDIQFIMVYYDKKDEQNKPYRFAVHGFDWYFYDEQIFGGNNDTLEENKIRYPNCYFKRGKWIDVDTFDKISKDAFDDYGEKWLYIF